MRKPLGGDPNGLLNGPLENGHDQDRRTIGDADLVSMIGRLASEPMKSGTDIPITICGMGMQLPGGIQDNELKPCMTSSSISMMNAAPPPPTNMIPIYTIFHTANPVPSSLSKATFLIIPNFSNFNPSTCSISNAAVA